MADDPFIITEDGDRPLSRSGSSRGEELESRRFRLTNWWKWCVAVLSLALFSGLLWYAYQSGTQDDGGPIQTVQADKEPFKVKPQDPGGLQIPDQDKLVFSEAVGRPDEGPETLAPASETPMPKPEPVISEVTPPKPKPVVPPIPAVQPKPAAAPKPVTPPTKPADQVLAKPPGVAENVAEKAPAATTPPAPEPTADAPLSRPPGAGVSGASLAAQSKIDVPKPLAPNATGVSVQLGSFSGMDAAKQGWSEIRPRYPDILVSPNAQVKQAVVNGKTYHRLMVGPYASRDDADIVCNLLKSRGRDCFIVLP